MPRCLIFKTDTPRPAGSTAPIDRDLPAAIAARASLLFWGDGTTMAHAVTAGVDQVTTWPSRAGGTSYAQALAAQQPVFHATGGPDTRAWMAFSGAADASGDRMLPSWPTAPLGQALTIVDVIKGAVETTGYLDGQIGAADDAIAGFVQPTRVTQQWGDARAQVAITSGAWTVALRSIDGAGLVEAHANGAYAVAEAVVQPSTVRALVLGAQSGFANGNPSTSLYKGGLAARMIFREWIGGDRAFFRDVVGAYLAAEYGLPANPVAAVA
jgi:hypothetical protein